MASQELQFGYEDYIKFGYLPIRLLFFMVEKGGKGYLENICLGNFPEIKIKGDTVFLKQTIPSLKDYCVKITLNGRNRNKHKRGCVTPDEVEEAIRRALLNEAKDKFNDYKIEIELIETDE